MLTLSLNPFSHRSLVHLVGAAALGFSPRGGHITTVNWFAASAVMDFFPLRGSSNKGTDI